MSDFDNLPSNQRLRLQIILDGLIEAAVQAARVQNIGLSEALSLTLQAVLREAAARSHSRESMEAIWDHALEKVATGFTESPPEMVN